MNNRKPSLSIKHDPIHPADYNNYIIPMSCEECSHYSIEKDFCTIGFEIKWHKAQYQKRSYELTGKVPICRFMEID